MVTPPGAKEITVLIRTHVLPPFLRNRPLNGEIYLMSKERYDFTLYDYTLMDNNSHFLIERVKEPLSRMMQVDLVMKDYNP